METLVSKEKITENKLQSQDFTLKSFFVLLLFLALAIEGVVSNIIPAFSYLDEIVALSGLFFFIFSKKTRFERKFFVFLLIFIVLGVIGNITARYVARGYFFEIAVDILSICKMFFVYFGFIRVFNDVQKEAIADKYIVFIRIFVLAAFICLVLTYSGVLEFHDGLRYGLKQYRFILLNAGNFGYLLMSFLPFLFFRKRKGLIFLTYVLIFFTLKGPQILFVLFSIIALILKKLNIKINVLVLLALLILVVFIGQYQIQNYFLNKEAARYLLLKYSIIDANTHFFGSGFATYGSEMSRRIYPALYYEYGFNEIWGMSKQDPYFLLDFYWTMILGQFGYIGFVIFAGLFVSFFLAIWKRVKRTELKSIFVLIFLCFLIGSIGAAYFISYLGVLNFLTLSFFVRDTRNEQH